MSLVRLIADAPKIKMSAVMPGDLEFGTKLSVIEFLERVLDKTLTDYDGHGRFVFEIDEEECFAEDDFSFSIDDDVVYYNKEPSTSILWFCKTFNIKYIIWYNK